jgi:uncharacterized protein (DUF2141 family)
MCARNNTSITLIILISTLVLSCATPIPPTGGLVDRSSPSVLSTVPKSGAVQYNGQVIRIDFDRFMSRNSLQRAIQIEPDLGIDYTIDWKRKTMLLRFDSPFPDSVTVIVSLSSNIADGNGNRLNTPYQIAFSTGSSIDSASVDFRVYSFDQAKGISGQKVGLFRKSSDKTAVYVAESDTSGTVRFRYLSRGTYTAILFDDRNRNRMIDENEFFVTLPQNVQIETDTLHFGGHFVFNRQDTIPPSVLGVGLLSSNRIRVRFSESIRLSKIASLSIIDEQGNRNPGIWMYSDPLDGSIAIGRSKSVLDPKKSYHLEINSVTDGMGNQFSGESTSFMGSSRADTTTQRIIRFPDPSFVIPTDTFLVVYSDIIAPGAIEDSLIIIDGEHQIRNWKDRIFTDNKMYIYRSQGWIPGQSYQIRYWSPSEQRHRNQNFRVRGLEDLSSLELEIPGSWKDMPITIELLDDVGIIVYKVNKQSSDRKILITSLAPGNYRLRAWVDLNRNGRWDQIVTNKEGGVFEQVFIQPSLILSARMTSVVQIEDYF